MELAELEGTSLPDGELTIESWQAFLWADATRNEEAAFRYGDAATEQGEAGQLVPPTMCQHLAVDATGGIEGTLGNVAPDWKEGAALARLDADFNQPIRVHEPYHVSGYIPNVATKDGSRGELTFVTFEYDVTTTAGEPVYDLSFDVVLFDA
ncbi:MaoC family dehydratase [Haloarchaeobius sp. DFWS5]|uniref:MaoC family dehydratase n=1 Tax=Haloarchaeobius sp. DFWS5 TaxID=3446114 RepID=UPI003EB6EAF7